VYYSGASCLKGTSGFGFQVVNILFKIFKEKKMKKLMVMVATLAMFASSAYAADWNFYGSARISTFWVNSETIGTNTDTTNYVEGLQGNSRFGAKVKVSDELTARFEYGTGVNVRLLYGTWNFGAGSLTVGQDYTPLNWFYSDQVYGGDGDLLPYGGLYSGREGQLKLKFGGLHIALLNSDKAYTGTAVTTDTKVPGIEVTYSMNFDNLGFKLGGGYQTFGVEAAGIDDDVTSWVLALGAKGTFGAFYLAGNIYGGQNAGNMIVIGTNGTWNQQGLAAIGTTVVDNDVLGGILVAGFALNDMFNFEAGYGFAQAELDVNNSNKDKVQSYYVNSTITMAPGVFVVPELGRIDGRDDGDTDSTYFGMKWQINF
jgi:hypothetical protein